MLRKELLQEGWLEISYKNTSPAQLIMRIFSFFFLILWIIFIMHRKEEPYEMKISSTVLERRFFDLNDDRNGCQLNPKEIMRKLYRIIMKLCD
jgi:hypothetical protein